MGVLRGPPVHQKEDVLLSMKLKEENEWMDDETEQLIEYHKHNDQLWNHILSSYRDRNLKKLNYKKLSEILPGRSQENIKKQWNTIKTIFFREVKREEGSKVGGTGTDSVYKSQWKFFDTMMFLKGSDGVDPSISTLVDAWPQEYNNPTKQMKMVQEKEFEEVKLELYKEAIKCLQTLVPPAESGCGSDCRNPNDETDLFIRTLGSTLRRFTSRHHNDVIFNLEMELYPPETTSTFTCAYQGILLTLLIWQATTALNVCHQLLSAT